MQGPGPLIARRGRSTVLVTAEGMPPKLTDRVLHVVGGRVWGFLFGE